MKRLLMVLAFSLLSTGVAWGQCITNVENHTWIIQSDALDAVASSGDTLRAFSPRGTCVGESVYQQDTNMGLAVAGQTSLDSLGMEPGESITFRLGGTVVQMGQPQIYEIDGITNVSQVTLLTLSASWDQDTLRVTQDQWQATATLSAPESILAFTVALSSAIDSIASGPFTFQAVGDTTKAATLGTSGPEVPITAYGTATGVGTQSVTLYSAEVAFEGDQVGRTTPNNTLIIDRVLLGDVNQDGVVNEDDVSDLLQHLLFATVIDLNAADVTGNGIVNLGDALALWNQVQ